MYIYIYICIDIYFIYIYIYIYIYTSPSLSRLSSLGTHQVDAPFNAGAPFSDFGRDGHHQHSNSTSSATLPS